MLITAGSCYKSLVMCLITAGSWLEPLVMPYDTITVGS